MRAALLLVATLAACGPDETPQGIDMTGRFNVIVEGTNGCDNDASLVAWMEGPMVVEGTPDALTFDFLDGFVFQGVATASSRFSFSGTTERDGLQFSAFGSGSATGAAGAWSLEGEGGALVDNLDGDPDNDCTISAPFSAVQLAP